MVLFIVAISLECASMAKGESIVSETFSAVPGVSNVYQLIRKPHSYELEIGGYKSLQRGEIYELRQIRHNIGGAVLTNVFFRGFTPGPLDVVGGQIHPKNDNASVLSLIQIRQSPGIFIEVPVNNTPLEAPNFQTNDISRFCLPPIPFELARDHRDMKIESVDDNAMHVILNTYGSVDGSVRHLSYAFKEKKWTLLPPKKKPRGTRD